MAFSFEQPQEPNRLNINRPSPKVLLGLGVGVAAVIVAIIIGVVLWRNGASPAPIDAGDGAVEQGSGEQAGGVVGGNGTGSTGAGSGTGQTPPPAAIEYRNPPAPTLTVGETHILSAEEKELYGFPAEVTVRRTIVAGENGQPTAKFEIVDGQ